MRRGETSTRAARRLVAQQPGFGQELAGEARRVAGALELAHDRLADLVRQLLAADLDEEGAHAPPSAGRRGFAPSRPRARRR